MKIKMLAAATALMIGSSTAMALPSLGDITGNAALDPVKDTGAEAVSLTDLDQNVDTSTSHLLLEIAGYANGNEFGIYSFSNFGGTVSVLDTLKLFDGNDSAITTRTITFDLLNGTAEAGGLTKNIGGEFGFYLKNVEQDFEWFSHTSLNSDGYDHALIFHPFAAGLEEQSPLFGSNVAVAFEDLCNTDCGNDGDYNDILVGLNDVVPVPEPGTLALLGLGLVGLGAARRRKA